MKQPLKWGVCAVLAIALIFGITLLQQEQKQEANTPTEKVSKQTRIGEAYKHYVRCTKDPALGYTPIERLATAIEETRVLQGEVALTKNQFKNARFRERGPNNIGGRTRALLIDQNDPSGKTFWAGSVSGGLWKTTNITVDNPNWEKADDYMENLSIGSIAQDRANPALIYVGTGEGFGGGINMGVGTGMYRSTDGGESWESLENTAGFGATRSILVHPSGTVYAATALGIQRSMDQGVTWERVFGRGGTGGLNDAYDVLYIPKSDMIYFSTINAIYKSATGDTGSWENITAAGSAFLTGTQRIEMAVAYNNPQVIYALGNSGGSATSFYRTLNGGLNWQNLGPVGGFPDFTNGQAWYDLDIAVNPYNDNNVVAGGVPIFHTVNGGTSWQPITNNMHVDQHKVLFDIDRRGVVYYGNDGGVWRSPNGTAGNKQNRNFGYNVTQFYAGALHPDAFSNYILGGTQDNNSLQMDAPGIAPANIVLGGDGMLCHIDQSDPEYQLVSSQFGNYALSVDGGGSFSGGASITGSFVNPSDYDDDANILYAQTFLGDYVRWQIPTGEPEYIDIEGIDLTSGLVSVVIVDPVTPNRLYLGTFGQGLLRIDDANQGDVVSAKQITNFSANGAAGSISSVAVDPLDGDHILVTFSNFGLRNNIYESKDGGATWSGVEGNLPDMPVRWVLFDPNGGEEAVIATAVGVWFTEKLDGNNTVWIPPTAGRGIPLVSTHMLQMRESDNILLAATHGRGMFTSDIFAEPKVFLGVDEVSYIDANVFFDGTLSFGAQNFLWNFGDGATDTLENTFHQYDKIGEYEYSLTINDNLTEKSSIKILPDKAVPYIEGRDGYSGDFENNPEDYGTHTISGSSFERGKTDFRGKDGVNSGENAFVLGLNEEYYQPNTHAVLYMPNYEFEEEGIYEFSFWSKYEIQQGFDGFRVEYSTNKGENWNVLGDADDDNWYDHRNTNVGTAAFPIGTSYFGRINRQWKKFYIDVSFLSGNPDVAFRFVFRSDGSGNHPGVAIDDVEIKKYQGELQTDIVRTEATYTSFEDALVSWSTQPEYHAKEFIVERSFNGRDYVEVGSVPATGKTTDRIQHYEFSTDGVRNLYFFRIRSINESRRREYEHEFVTEPLVVRRDFEDVDVFRFFPNPITDYLEFTFTEFVTDDVKFELFDVAGKLLYEETRQVNNIYTKIEFPHLDLPKGVYFLSYQIGDRDINTIRLLAME